MQQKGKNKRANISLVWYLFQVFFLSTFWSIFLGVHLENPKWVFPFWFLLISIFLIFRKPIEENLLKNSPIVVALNVVFTLLTGIATFLSLQDPLCFKAYSTAYYLIFLGSSVGILSKTFLRRESIIGNLLLTSIGVFLATLNVFILIGFLLGNIVAADIYEHKRDTTSILKATALGNAIFCFSEIGYWIQIDPLNLWRILYIYPLSVVSVIYHIFGLQKLLDLLPFMYSDEKLEKLANLSNPLLEEMMIRAPGTYHHSVMVSLLAETIARKLGADALLTRVGAMFHDIGKMVNPLYFIENANGKNYHEGLKPEVSASIIKSHVEEGIALARKYNLPEEIISFIPEHQGTKLIGFFYHKALKENPKVDESIFRYEGPIPQSKETAIVMIADTVEAMVRALKNPTKEDIEKTVKKAIKTLLEEGQLKDSQLSPEELKKIEELLKELLISYYHKRVKYPERTTRKGKV